MASHPTNPMNGGPRRGARGRSGSAVVETALTRPLYLIVFKRPSERNASLMSKVMKAGTDRKVGERAGRVVLEAKGETGARTRIYHRLGVAVADLDPDQMVEIAADENVETVVPNEVRSIPPIIAADAPTPPSADSQAGRNDVLIAYLRGQRDALEQTLRLLGAAPGGAALPALAMPYAPSLAFASGTHSWCLDLVGLPSTYERYGGRGTIVAVLDTGIDLEHPDFRDRFASGANIQSFVPGESVQDGNGHGTHCAGVIAGPRRSSGGIRYGVAPDATLLVGKVLSNEGFGYDDQILDAIDWAADLGAHVISMSLGSERRAYQPYAIAYERVASNLLALGTLIVAAAGNESDRPYSTAPVGNPAACPSVISVAAIDRQRAIAYFSCRELDDIGQVDIAAPGVAVHSAWRGGSFRSISGTSMATPHVAGLVALLREKHPSLGAKDLWRVLTSGATMLQLDRQDVGSGLAQAPAVIAEPAPSQPCAVVPERATRRSRDKAPTVA